MSTWPGPNLEDFLMYNFDILVEGECSANPSMDIYEALNPGGRHRPILTQEEFAPLVAAFEVHRRNCEYWLEEYDEESQSWRDYAGSSFNFMQDDLDMFRVPEAMGR